VTDTMDRLAAFFGLPGAPASTAPTLSAFPMFVRLELEDLFGGSAPPPTTNPVPVITGLFQQILRQDPTLDELQTYTNVWNLTGINGVVAGLYSSTAFRQTEVNTYYLELLGRQATSTELSWGTFRLQWGTPEAVLAASIAGTSEFYQDSAVGGGTAGVQPTATTFVNLLYRTLLGEPADPNVAPIYVQEVQGGLPTVLAALGFATSDPFREVKIQEIYDVVLGRDATADEVANYLDRWLFDGGLTGIATVLLASAANVARIEAGDVHLPDMAAAAQLEELLLAPYNQQDTGFVKLFNSLFGDPTVNNPCTTNSCGNPALYQLLTAGGDSRGIPNSSIKLTSMSANVGDLIPTQNEISMEKSLKDTLQDADTLKTYFEGGIVQPGDPLVTADNGAYIIDGHHRWSSVYVINPHTQVVAVDLGYVPNPQAALKQTQIAIAAQNGYLQGSTASGDNLYTIDEATFNAAIHDYISTGADEKGVLKVFTKYLGLDNQTKDQKYVSIENYLWSNVLRMRADNPYIPGATSREYMPQTSPLIPILARMDSPSLLSYSFPIISYLG